MDGPASEPQPKPGKRYGLGCGILMFCIGTLATGSIMVSVGLLALSLSGRLDHEAENIIRLATTISAFVGGLACAFYAVHKLNSMTRREQERLFARLVILMAVPFVWLLIVIVLGAILGGFGERGGLTAVVVGSVLLPFLVGSALIFVHRGRKRKEG